METGDIKDWMEQVEDAMFQALLEAVKGRKIDEAQAWAALMERVGLV